MWSHPFQLSAKNSIDPEVWFWTKLKSSLEAYNNSVYFIITRLLQPSSLTYLNGTFLSEYPPIGNHCEQTVNLWIASWGDVFAVDCVLYFNLQQFETDGPLSNASIGTKQWEASKTCLKLFTYLHWKMGGRGIHVLHVTVEWLSTTSVIEKALHSDLPGLAGVRVHTCCIWLIKCFFLLALSTMA